METDFKGTRLTLEQNGVKVSWEVDNSNTTIGDLLDAFAGLCVAHTYIPESIVKACGDYYEENKNFYSDLAYDVENED